MRLAPPLMLLMALTTLNCGGAPCGAGTCSDAGAVGIGSGFGGGTGGGTGTGGGSGQDAGSIDSGALDAGPTDAGDADAGRTDAGDADAGSTDAGARDGGAVDAGLGSASDAGACGPCIAPPNGTASCDGQSCTVTCDTGYARCFRQGVAVCAPTTANDSCGLGCELCLDTIGSTSTCDGTRCVTSCRPGYHRCGYNECVPDDSIVACGAACTRCPAPPAGSNQVATCDQGLCGTRCVATCNGTCVDPDADEQNCGGCGVVCQSGTSCINGQCTGVCRYELDLARGTPVANLESLQVGDVDGDGRADGIFTGAVALSRFDGGSVSFVVRTESALGLPLAVADFTRDGRADVVMSNGSALLLSVSTDAGFAAPTVLSPAHRPVVTGDFDERNGPDLAMVMADRTQLTVQLNGGAGTFTSGVPEYFGSNILSLFAGDLNGDGHRDLVVMREGTPRRVEALVGDGQGRFTRGGILNAPNGPARVKDADADGRDELTFDPESNPTNYAYAWSAAGAWVQVPSDGMDFYVVGDRSTDGGLFQCNPYDYLACSDGWMQTSMSELTFAGTRSVHLADVTGDGLKDVIALSPDGGIAAVVRSGDSVSVHPASWGSQGNIEAVTDLNADGYLDLAFGFRSQAFFALTGPHGLVGPAQPLTDAGVVIDALNAVDLDGDEFGDLIVGPRDTEARAALLFRGGAGGVSPAGRIPLYDPANQAPLGTVGLEFKTEDIDGDGMRDVIVWIPGRYFWARALGSGLYSPLRHLAEGSLLVFGDVNGDGRPDYARSAFGSLVIRLNAGGGVFRNGFDVPLPSGAGPVGLRDLNGDGKLDVDLFTQVRYGDGTGSFSSPVAAPAGLHFDADRDGRFDTFQTNGLVTLTGSGSSQTTAYVLQGWAFRNGVVDLNRDGVLDGWWYARDQLTQGRAVCR